jgi:hypothetical protein
MAKRAKEDKLVDAPRWHAQVLHLALAPDHRTHGPPCALRIVVDQVVDNHACRCVGNQRDQQDHCPAAEPIAHHRPIEDQVQALQGPIDWYVKGIIKIDDNDKDIENKFSINDDWCIEHQHIIKHVKDQGWFS